MTRLSLIGLLAAAATLASVSLHAQEAPVPPPATPATGNPLPEGRGRETLMRVCSGCHDPYLVAEQRHSEEEWHALVQLMAGNGAQGTDAEFAEITAYLAKNFPAGQ